MITIIHGDDIVSSRNFLVERKTKAENPISFVGDNLSLTDLMQASQADGLFGISEKQVFIEDFFIKKKSSEFKNIISYLQKQSKSLNITIWESKVLSKSQLSTFKTANIELFTLPKSLFLFLNELKPQNSKKLIYLFHETLKTTEEELVFYMLIRQFRLMLGLSDKKTGGSIDEVKNMAPWQMGKLEKQASFFSNDQLKAIYKKIASIDLQQKTGATILSLVQSSDFLLLSI